MFGPRDMKYVKSACDYAVFGACLAFTLFQSHQCFKKFQRMPKGVHIEYSTLDNVGENNFPAITLCKSHTKSFWGILDSDSEIEDKLKECGITMQVIHIRNCGRFL